MRRRGKGRKGKKNRRRVLLLCVWGLRWGSTVSNQKGRMDGVLFKGGWGKRERENVGGGIFPSAREK